MNMKEKMEPLQILVLDQGRQALPFLKSLSKAGHKVICVCHNRTNEVYLSRYPSKRLIWPSYVTERLAFELRLMNYLKENNIDITLSVGDISSDILSKNQEAIKKNTRITSPDYSTFLRASDKLNLMNYCMLNKLPCPKTYDLNEDNANNIEELIGYPVIVKPTRGVGAIGLVRFDKHEELVGQYKALTNKYGSLIVQEYIPQENGMQYQTEAFLDAEAKMKVCMVIEKPRFFPVRGGTSTANVTINHAEIRKITKELLEGLKWVGAADVDFILDPRDNVIKILEINPRVTAGIKIGFVAGIDYADLHLKLALGEEIPPIEDYKLGIYCRNFFLESLWFLFSDCQMKKKTRPSFFKLFGKDMVDQVISFDDPLTGLGFFLGMIRKYTSIHNFREKFHK